MVDDSSMDKKASGRSGSAPSKSGGSESKTKQDVATAKYPRAPRRRESPRPEPSRKPNPQRNKGIDKRPKPRGFYCNERDRSDVAEVSWAEIGSAQRQGPKKLNLNHLLNFTYTPRDSVSHAAHVSPWGGSWKTRNKLWSTKKHKYNKEQFLQANCQFVVRTGGDYSIHAVDPDLLVDWDAIELVRLPSHEVPSCPICLYQPVAAKITRCGHVYCWACILHYLALSDKTWRKCPICFESVHKTDLKSVVPLSTHQYAVGEEIVMRLMRREKGSVFAMAKTQWEDRKGELLPLDNGTDGTRFAKLLTAPPEQVQEFIINRERAELKVALAENKDCPEVCFIEAALQSLLDREKGVTKDQTMTALVNEMVPLSIENEDKVVDQLIGVEDKVHLPEGLRGIKYACAFSEEVVECVGVAQETDDSLLTTGSEATVDLEGEADNEGAAIEGRTRYESTSTDSVEDGAADGATAEDLDIGDISVAKEVTEQANPNNYYFYQAADGQHIYLHALNVRMLVKEYGSLQDSPDTITAKIVEKEGISMSEELRRRLRYLCHLPLTCEFEVVELNIRPPVVSRKVVDEFKEDVEKRRRRRNKKERDERRRDRHIEELENRKWGRFPTARLNLDSRYQFPDCSNNLGDDEFIPLPLPAADSPTCSSPASVSSSITSNVVDPILLSPVGSCEDASSAPSFAQMLRDGKARAEAASLKPASGAVDDRRPPSSKSRRSFASDSEPEDYVPAPEYHLSFGDAIQAALQKATCPETDGVEQVSNKKKKGKQGKQKKLLFTTSMARTK